MPVQESGGLGPRHVVGRTRPRPRPSDTSLLLACLSALRGRGPQSPERALAPRRRGYHRLLTHSGAGAAADALRCTGCLACPAVCPAQCIRIEVGEPSGGHAPAIPLRFDIDELSCVGCGLCVEACADDALAMDPGLRPPVYDSAAEFVYDRRRLSGL